jgi:lipopolysaccharide export system permease protein
MLALGGTHTSRAEPAHGASTLIGAGIPRLYAMGVVRQIILQVALIVLLIEGIFLTEKLTSILRAAIDHHVSAGNVILLLVYTAPQIFDLALPLALMIGVYRVILRCREDREFLVLAGMGIGLHQFIGLAMAIGASAMALSLFVSGTVDPHTRFAHRSVLFDAQHEALRGGITPGQFYFFDAYTVFAGETTVARPERRLFVHHDQGPTQRVIVAARARLSDPDDEGYMTLHLGDIVAQDFSFDANPSELGTGGTVGPDGTGSGRDTAFTTTPLATMRIGNFARDLNLDQLVRFEPRGRTADEWTLPELAGLSSAPAPQAREHVSELGHRFARALLCLIAPLIAGLTLAMTTRGSQALILPAACAVVMFIDLATSRLASMLGGIGPVGMVFALVAATAVVGLLLVRQAAALQHAIIKPALARA